MLVRKTVTVIFCDLTGSTPLGGRTDPEVMRRVLARYFGEMRAVIERHGGTVEKFIGDAVMAVFGVPAVHEDDAFRAVRAADEMRTRLSDLNPDLERDHGVRIQARIGVNTGKVVAEEAAGADALVTGDVVNVAKRFEESAHPGEVLIGELTRRLISEGVEVGPSRALTLKGKSGTVQVWPLMRVSSETAPPLGRLETPLVGRTTELGQLRSAYEAAVQARELYVFTLLGVAGIGKSRLGRELCRSVVDEATVLAGRCLPYGEGITFWPIAEIVRDAGGPDSIDRALAGGPDAAVVVQRVRGVIGAGGASGSGEETFWAVRRYFEALAQERPLVLCLEDVHWAEPTLLDLIDYLHGWSREAPILVLVLARPELLERRAAPTGERSELLLLEPLTPSESSALLELLADEFDLDASIRERIARTAEGNPLFLEQVAAMLAERPALDERVVVPPSVQALISARLDRLSSEEQAVVERAAVVGRDFPLAAVVDLCPSELRASAGAHLLALARSGLVQPHVDALGSGDAFRFRHGLIREVAYERVPKALRAELHELFAEWLRSAAADRLTEIEEVVGYHFEQAYRCREQLGPLPRAAHRLASQGGKLLGSAGRRAFERDDMPAAINLLERADSLLLQNQATRLEVRRDLSAALWAVRRFDDADVLLDRLLDEARASGDRRLEWSARLERAGRRHITDPRATADELLEITQLAIHAFEEIGDEHELARAWRTMSLVPRARGQYGISKEAIERALVHAHRANDEYEEARLSGYLCTVLFLGPTPASDAIDRCETLLLRAERSRSLQATIATFLAGLYAMRREFDRARALCTSGESIFVDLGLELTQVGSTEMAGYIELLAGLPAAAEAALRRGFGMLSDAEPALRAFPAALVAEALLEQGRTGEAAKLARISEENAPAHDVETQVRWRRARAKIEAQDGSLAQAEAHAREAVALADKTDALNLRADALVRLGEILRSAGDEDAAGETFRRAIELFERKGNEASAARASSLLTTRVA